MSAWHEALESLAGKVAPKLAEHVFQSGAFASSSNQIVALFGLKVRMLKCWGSLREMKNLEGLQSKDY